MSRLHVTRRPKRSTVCSNFFFAQANPNLSRHNSKCSFDSVSLFAVTVDFSKPQDIPLFKKYAVMNSGLIQSSRYNDSVLKSFGLIRVRSPPKPSLHNEDSWAPFIVAMCGGSDAVSTNRAKFESIICSIHPMPRTCSFVKLALKSLKWKRCSAEDCSQVSARLSQPQLQVIWGFGFKQRTPVLNLSAWVLRCAHVVPELYMVQK